MSTMPTHAMMLAAGLGLRLRPLTLDRPKALVEVGGRTLVDRNLDRLEEVGIGTVVINVHHKANSLRRHLRQRSHPTIVFSDETDQLLETGGGVAKALPLLGDRRFVVLNCDIIWRDSQGNSLRRLAERWDDTAMDALLLLHPTVTAIGYEGKGDFEMDPEGRLQRRGENFVAPFVFTGVQILHPRLFQDVPAGPFSLNLLYDRAAEAGRLFGLRHEGDWMDVGSPAGLQAAEATLAARIP